MWSYTIFVLITLPLSGVWKWRQINSFVWDTSTSLCSSTLGLWSNGTWQLFSSETVVLFFFVNAKEKGIFIFLQVCSMFTVLFRYNQCFKAALETCVLAMLPRKRQFLDGGKQIKRVTALKTLVVLQGIKLHRRVWTCQKCQVLCIHGQFYKGLDGAVLALWKVIGMVWLPV